jgi:hypothetical protein
MVLADITRTSVVAAGNMGSGTAEVFAKASYEMTMTPEAAGRSGQAWSLGRDEWSSCRRTAPMVSSLRAADWHTRCDAGKETPSCTLQSC